MLSGERIGPGEEVRKWPSERDEEHCNTICFASSIKLNNELLLVKVCVSL